MRTDMTVSARRPDRAALRHWARRFTTSTTGTARVWALTILLVAIAAVLLAIEVPAGQPTAPPVALPWWLLAVLFYVTESKVVHLHIGRSAHSFSMSEIPVVYGIFFFRPGEFIVARLIGAGLALVFSRRQRSVKLGFNLAQFLLCSVVTVGVVHLLVDVGADFGPRAWPAAFLATTAENMVGVFAVTAAISLAEGALQHARIPRMLLMGAVVSLTNTSLALLLITVLFVEPAAALLFAVPILAVFVAYRAYVSERQQHEGLEMLYESTRILQRSPQIDQALVSLLDHARRMFRAEIAEASLLPQIEGQEILRTRVGPGEAVDMMSPIGTTLDDPRLVRCVAERRAFLVAGESAPGQVDGGRFRNAIYAPLVGESRLVGTIVVANRLSDLTPFDADDLKLFQTLASHTAIALENGQLEQSLSSLSRLQDELHHKAYHDALTGLANRAFFAQSVAQRLESADASGLVPVVLFLDLDDFKIVNDTLGHAAGDELLASVGERIQATVRSGDLAARIGGDEFAVLLWDTPEMPVARRIAERLIEAFGAGAPEDGAAANAPVSIGVAAGHPGFGSADELLRNADVAMYSAKARGKNRIAFFEPEMATAVAARHTLTESLQRAVAAEEFVLHYQPIFEIATGRITGVESLVRWMHPTRGMVWPGEFIPVAETSDLILDIGRWVLVTSCRQAREWHDRWPELRDLQISVNVAGRQLEQPDFVDQVAEIVASSGIDPTTVVLEVTETTLLQNAEDAIAKLEALRGLGMGVAIDDFGTGYSSLSYLQRFPATAIKIARDFVAVDEVDTDSWELASAIVSMGRALRLTVIAEGVEEPFQLDRLRKLRCGRAQGYYLARPIPAEEIEELFSQPRSAISWSRAATTELVDLASRDSSPAA
ncbi:MAG TPA: EAL domain-containing protein [Verrucomicrobiae bacterium]|jgi:diguanylate cyclase (GGDEF)-like protein|nr:EAL domain-containing protein [Verrucomicrobiae bacterium]